MYAKCSVNAFYFAILICMINTAGDRIIYKADK